MGLSRSRKMIDNRDLVILFVLLIILFVSISVAVYSGFLLFADYVVCGWGDILTPFKDNSRVIHDYFCYLF
jgi:hypothetical protein